jgi:hypothetical protein
MRTVWEHDGEKKIDSTSTVVPTIRIFSPSTLVSCSDKITLRVLNTVLIWRSGLPSSTHTHTRMNRERHVDFTTVREYWSIEGWIHCKRRNRLCQETRSWLRGSFTLTQTWWWERVWMSSFWLTTITYTLTTSLGSGCECEDDSDFFCEHTESLFLEYSCLLWIDKTRAKDKIYIWVSVWWKTTN